MNTTAEQNQDMKHDMRAELYNKSVEELCSILHLSPQDYTAEIFSKEQLIEFILTPLD